MSEPTGSLEYQSFGLKVKRLTGIDLAGYKSTQMERRLQTIMRKSGVEGYTSYAALLQRDPTALKDFVNFITINVSEFFRNPEKFEELRQNVLPELLRQRGTLRVWSAGCSNGAEPYSLAILLDEMTGPRNHFLLASDLDAQILRAAQAGFYLDKDLKNVSPRRRRKYFNPRPDGEEVQDWLRSRVTFRRHDLLKDPFESDLDLIVCRNVVIYFTEPVKETLYRRFVQALRPGGMLFVGGTESILKARDHGLEPIYPFFYRKALQGPQGGAAKI